MKRVWIQIILVASLFCFVSISAFAKPPKSKIESTLKALSKRESILLGQVFDRPSDVWSLQVTDQKDGFRLILLRDYTEAFDSPQQVFDVFVSNSDERNKVNARNPSWLTIYAQSLDRDSVLKGEVSLSLQIDEKNRLKRFRVEGASARTKKEIRAQYFNLELVPASQLKSEEAKRRRESIRSCASKLHQLKKRKAPLRYHF